MPHFGINGILQNSAYVLKYIVLNTLYTWYFWYFALKEAIRSNIKLNVLRGALC